MKKYKRRQTMKRLIKSLTLILLLLSLPIHAQPQGQDEPIKDDSLPVELPKKQIIKDIKVGAIRHSVLSRSNQGIADFKIPWKEKIVVFELFHWDGDDEYMIKYWYKLEPFDLKWDQVYGSVPSITYSRLAPGSYVFKVKRSLLK
jgi:hypothetical protein